MSETNGGTDADRQTEPRCSLEMSVGLRSLSYGGNHFAWTGATLYRHGERRSAERRIRGAFLPRPEIRQLLRMHSAELTTAMAIGALGRSFIAGDCRCLLDAGLDNTISLEWKDGSGWDAAALLRSPNDMLPPTVDELADLIGLDPKPVLIGETDVEIAVRGAWELLRIYYDEPAAPRA